MSGEFENNLEELEENFEDGFEAAEEIQEDPITETSQTETSQSAREALTSDSGRRSLLKSLTVYDAMLIASTLSIALACMLLFLELTSFGGLFFWWRTGEAFVEPLTP